MKKLSDETVATIVELHATGMPAPQIAKNVPGVALSTVYSVLHEHELDIFEGPDKLQMGLDNETFEQLFNDYYRLCLPMRQITHKYRRTSTQINLMLDRNDLPQRKFLEEGVKLRADMENLAVALYIRGIRLADIQNETGLYPQQVNTLIQERGVQGRGSWGRPLTPEDIEAAKGDTLEVLEAKIRALRGEE